MTGGLRPEANSFQYHGRKFALDVFSVNSAAPTNMGKCVDGLSIEAADEKHSSYEAECFELGIKFVTFGIDVVVRLKEYAETSPRMANAYAFRLYIVRKQKKMSRL